MSRTVWTGSFVALITPFRNGKVDAAALEKMVEFHVANGTNGLVPCGSTGESATLSPEEHEEVIRLVIRVAKKRLPVLAGTGSNNTAEAVALTKAAEKDGADGSLQIVPYYNKPTQEGLYRHFKAVAEATRLPIMLYNIPGRTGVNMTADTVARLADVPNIVAIKEASANLEQMAEIVARCGDRIALFSGDDALTLPILALGGIGVVSVVANLLPRQVADLCSAFRRGDLQVAREIHEKLLPLTQSLFIETNPIPVKTAMAMLGRCAEEFRLPLTPMEAAHRTALRAALTAAGLSPG